MIRNYYTEAFKGGVIPVVSATQLIDGTVKITESTTATSVTNVATSVTLVLTLNVGVSPQQGNNFGSVTSATANAATSPTTTVTYKVSNPYVQSGMNVYDDGVLIGVVNTVTNSTQFELVNGLAANIVNDSVLTFSFSVLPSVSVLTIDNQTITFDNPAQGFVLPVSVVQVTAVAGGITTSNLLALN